MIVITLTDCSPALRGDLTKWLQEINTGVYVGRVNARVREKVWNRVKENIKSGRATMVFSTNNEQRMDFRVHNTSWEPIDFDGLKLILRPSPARVKKMSEARMGFSKAAKTRKARQMSGRKRSSKLPETYVIVNIETTGLSAKVDELVSLDAIIVKERQIESEFHALGKPQIISPSINAPMGISDMKHTQEGRDLEQVLPEFLEFVGDLPVVSHNADFDYGILRSACESCNLPLFSNRCIDTQVLARRLVDDVKNYKLQTLIDYFKINVTEMPQGIRACETTKLLYEKLIELQEKED